MIDGIWLTCPSCGRIAGPGGHGLVQTTHCNSKGCNGIKMVPIDWDAEHARIARLIEKFGSKNPVVEEVAVSVPATKKTLAELVAEDEAWEISEVKQLELATKQPSLFGEDW